ncbi:YceI family protein [Sphingobacterium gobiense]|uniref:Lipid/polyisoprenoid-binding YceI-like domain-containing protein n=1 Tax=Sphingobacterium gobiense TaxID=1382456 RepID=A0A2S9JV70_9SPHI|nr:YceI family protein [Sphingobacterium gobiense]PRD57143.1 hypothetical protein C5749_08050 [Sphingobacterium gobiense]
MRKLSALTVVAALALAACGGNSNADKVQTSTAQEVATETGTVLQLDPASSSIKWKAYHKGGFDPRFGTLESEGNLTLENDAISSGKFTIDMTSLRTDDNAVDIAKTGGKTAADLDGHLKNEDFFDVEKYPTSKLEITSVRSFDPAKDKSVLADATHVISGNLTIKEKTVNIAFPAKVSIQENEVNVQSKFSINRQDWGLTYGTDGDPKDWMISQEVDLEFDITAKK